MEDKRPANTAAWLTAQQAKLEVLAAPYTRPLEGEIVVKNRAVAINPIDWIIQVAGDMAFSWIRLPFILGSDLAGDVVEIGVGVTRFKIGDRVIAHAVGTDAARNRAAQGSFQAYTVVLEKAATPIPSDMSYERATVLPLGLSTAACGLFQKDHLALDYPSATAKRNGKTVLVWGGSTSVGSNAIQLAVAAGYEVIATASPRNFDYVRKLGALRVFDYNDKNVVRKLVDAFAGKTLAVRSRSVPARPKLASTLFMPARARSSSRWRRIRFRFKASGIGRLARCSGLPSCVRSCGSASPIGSNAGPEASVQSLSSAVRC